MDNILTDLEQAVNAVISIIQKEVRPELKDNIMTALHSFTEPLDALKDILSSIYQIINENKCVDENEQLLSTVKTVLIPCISDVIKYLTEIEELKCVEIADDANMQVSQVKEEMKGIEKTTAQPLEEIIEAIMVSQEQIEYDKPSVFGSTSSSTELIEPELIGNLNVTEAEPELPITVHEADSSAIEIVTCNVDATQAPQEKLISSPTSNQIEESVTQEKGTLLQPLADSSKEIEEQSLSAINQKEIKLDQLSDNNVMQEEKVGVDILEPVISSLQVLSKSFDDIDKIKLFKSMEEKPIPFTILIEPLQILDLRLRTEIQQITLLLPQENEGIKQTVVTLQDLPVVTILEKLQKSIVTIQEQLDAVVESSSSETSNLFSMQVIKETLQDLKTSITHIQLDSNTCQLIQQDAKLSKIQQITILKALINSIQEFAEKYTSIASNIGIEEYTSPLQGVERQDHKLIIETLQKVIDPIQNLSKAFSQIENLKNYKVDLSEIQKEEQETVPLKALRHSLEKLEKLLIANVQQITILQETTAKELCENHTFLVNNDLKLVLKELIDPIISIQQQIIFKEDVASKAVLYEALENVKVSATDVEETIDQFEVTDAQKVQTLITFAKSIEETTNQLLPIINQQEIGKISLLKLVNIPIEEMQEAKMRFEDQFETSEIKGTKKIIILGYIMQPLEQLHRALLAVSHQEIALQQLPIKPILEDLNKSVATLRDQVAIVEDKLLVEENSDDLPVLKDFIRSLSNLRTSTVVLQQLSVIENAGQQIIEIENTSALQAFAKSINEFKKCYLTIIERPKIREAFVTNVEPIKVNTQLLENIIAPLRILQEQILTIEEIKTQESEILDIAETNKPAIVLSSLVDPLQHLEKSFVAIVRKEHVIEDEALRLSPESTFASLENLTLQPILQEMQKSIATVQENIILETGNQVISEKDTVTLLKTIAQPLIDLKASIASIQQVTAVAPDPLNEFTEQQNISTLETFAETLHNLAECIAMCNHQQIVIEPAADTISEDASSLNTWADVIEESDKNISKITHPTVINQEIVESPEPETTVSNLEDDISMLKTLAKPLTELRECLALIVEERKMITPSETTHFLSEREDISILKTIVKPLLELRDAATVIHEQTIVERAPEHLFVIEGDNEFTLRPLIEPLEELRHSIAIIQDQLLIETLVDKPKEDIIFKTLTEPLLELQRAVCVLEARVMSPDVETLSEDTNNSWMTERLAVSLHEIDKSIADIRQCTIIRPETMIVEKQAKISAVDLQIIEKLIESMKDIRSVILCMEDEITANKASWKPSPKIKILKTMLGPLTNIQEHLELLRNQSNSSNEDCNVDALIKSLATFEKCVLFVEEEILKVDKSILEQSDIAEVDTAILTTINLLLTELKHPTVVTENSPSTYLQNLRKPLELLQNGLQTVLTLQQREKLLKQSTKLLNTILCINDSIGFIKSVLERQKKSLDTKILDERATFELLLKPLQNITQCIAQIQEKPCAANLMIDAFENFDKSINVMKKQSSIAKCSTMRESSKKLMPCLQELQQSIAAVKTLWYEETVIQGLMLIENPFCELQTIFSIICEEFITEKPMIEIDENPKEVQKESVKEETEESKTETKILEQRVEEMGRKNEETEKAKSVEDKELLIINNDMQDKKDKEKSVEKDEAKEKRKEKTQEIDQKHKQTDEAKKQETIEKITEKEETKNKETEKIEKKVEQSKKVEDEKASKKIKEIENVEKQDDDEKKSQKRWEKESITNEPQESKEIIEVQKINKEKDEQKDIDEQQETKQVKSKQKENVEERKKLSKCEEIEKNLNLEREEVKENEKIKEIENIIKQEVQLGTEVQEKNEERKLKDMKESKGIKSTVQQHEGINNKEKKFEKAETDKTKQETSEYAEAEVTEIEKYNKSESKATQKEQDQDILNEYEKIENEQDYKNIENIAQLKKNENDQEEVKENQLEKEKQEEQEQQKQMEKVKQKCVNQKEEQELNELQTEEKWKENEEIAKLGKKVEQSSKKKKSAQIKKEEKKNEKKEDEKPKEKEEIQRQTMQDAMQADETKATKDDQWKTIANKQENKVEIKKEDNDQENKEIEELNEQQSREKEEYIKTEEVQKSQNKYIDNIQPKDIEDINKLNHKKIIKDRIQEKTAYDTTKQENEMDTVSQELEEDNSLYLKQGGNQQKQTSNGLRQQERNELKFEKIKVSLKEEEYRQKSQKNQDWSYKEKADEFNGNDKYRKERERKTRQKANDDEILHRIERERLKRERNDEKISNGIDRLLRKETKRLRKKQEEEIFTNKQRREERIRENDWFRRRENESKYSFMLDTRYKPNKSTAMFANYRRDRREYKSLSDFEIPASLSNMSRSYSWRDSLPSLHRERIDDYWDYKLHDFSIDKYYLDAGLFHKRPKRRENRMSRARLLSLLKYKDYSNRPSDSPIILRTLIHPTRRGKTNAISRTDFDNDFSSSSYIGPSQSEIVSLK